MEIKSEKGEEWQFKLLDTGGKEENLNMLDEYICNAHGFILVFAINDNDSFEGIKNYVKQIKNNKKESLPMILVGNKCDLENERQVTKQQAQEYANSIGAIYFECSALTDANANCKNIFQECELKIIKKANSEEGGESKCVKCFIF